MARPSHLRFTCSHRARSTVYTFARAWRCKLAYPMVKKAVSQLAATVTAKGSFRVWTAPILTSGGVNKNRKLGPYRAFSGQNTSTSDRRTHQPSEELMAEDIEPAGGGPAAAGGAAAAGGPADGGPADGGPAGGGPAGGGPADGGPAAGGAAAGGGPAGGGPGDDPNAPPSRSNNPTNNAVQRTRSWTGLWVIAVSDLVIAVAAIWGIVKTSSNSASSSSIVAILTSAFTAIGTLTTAYFGIKSVTNTAQSLVGQGGAGQGGAGQGGAGQGGAGQ